MPNLPLSLQNWRSDTYGWKGIWTSNGLSSGHCQSCSGGSQSSVNTGTRGRSISQSRSKWRQRSIRTTL
eukprot:12911991-Prorocentrum_lima.AAC.1